MRSRRVARSLGVLGSCLVVGAACARPPVPLTGRADAGADAGANATANADAGANANANANANARAKRDARAGALAPTREEVCRMPVAARGATRDDVKPFSRADGTCAGNFCDVADDPPKGADSCFVATRNITRAERESAGSRGVPRTRAEQSRVWDPMTAPRWLDRVDAHLHLDDAESSLLRANGFVVLDRLGYDSYAIAFHDVFQQQLPVYVGVDAIFNAVFQASQTILSEVERTQLGPKLVTMIDRMRSTLAASRGLYDAATVEDLDLYLVVAHRLLHPWSEAHARSPAVDALAESLIEGAKQTHDLRPVEIFGRERMIDFSQYVPRGHYADGGIGGGFDRTIVVKGQKQIEHISPRDYFLAMTWLSRIELNLVSRSCRSSQPGADVDPSETPREARDAIALADLVSRAGVAPDLRRFDEVYTVFAGSREDVPLGAIGAIAAKGGFGPRDADAPAKLKMAIADTYQRTARTHFMPDGASDLPAITTMFGPRIVPDIAPLTKLVHPAVPDRLTMGAADVGYVLGHDRAKKYLTDDLARHPTLASALDKSRAELAAGARGKADVYATWMTAALRLADKPSGSVPSFMRTDAYADMTMSSALAVFAQIRHTFVLLAGQGYDGYGCEIPDGYVEPAVAAYDGMIAWAGAARTAVPSEAAYFRRAEQVLGNLRAIAQTELSGAALSEPQRRWLGMIAEYTPQGGYTDSGEPPKYTGWYFDLFPDHEIGGERDVSLVADWITLTNADQVRHLGVEKAAIGAFVVDTGGAPRVMVGPVAKTYEVATSIDGRLNDEAARTTRGKEAPWLSYLAPKKPEPSLAARLFTCNDGARLWIESAVPTDVAVTLLDHHGDALGPAVSGHVEGTAAIVVAVPRHMIDDKRGIEGVHLHVGAPAAGDFVTGVSVYQRGAPSLYPVDGSRFDMAVGAMVPRER